VELGVARSKMRSAGSLRIRTKKLARELTDYKLVAALGAVQCVELDPRPAITALLLGAAAALFIYDGCNHYCTKNKYRKQPRY
jgi:hypothetical protein